MRPQTALETLRIALGTLKDPSSLFDFHDYAHCTCGHIYLALTGERSNSGAAGQDDNSLYEEVMVDTALALGMDHSKLDDGMDLRSRIAARYVSIYTRRFAGGVRNVDRRDAIEAVQRAINRIEAAERKAMLDIVAEPRKTVARKEPSEEVALARLTKEEIHHG